MGSSIEIMSGWRCSCPPPCPAPCCCPPPGSWSEPSLFHTVGNSTMMRLPPERRGVKPFAVGLSPFVCAPAAHQRIIGLVVKTLWRYKPGITKGFFLRWQSWPARGGVAGLSVFLLFRPERADAQPARGIAALMQCCSLHGRPRTVASAATTVELSGLRSPVSPPGEAYTHTPMVGRRASTPDFCLLAPAPRHLQPAAEKLFRWK